jgi:glycosyltransferase involved in cell wall biosynthesis
MSDCRIYLFTYKRNNILPRAITSLIAQTLTDWICEVHNDCPQDDFPGEHIASLNDPRFIIKNHLTNLGGVISFNLAIGGCTEKYVSILEDDNWWEPTFLEVMLKELCENDHIEVAVANEKIWIEEPDGSWTDAKKTIWPTTTGTTLYDYQLKDKCGAAKICNSSMVWRTRHTKNWLTPDDIPIDVTEHFRERVMPHPILLVNTPLVNFSQTIHTSRAKGLVWGSYQTLLIASVFANLNNAEKDDLAETLWDYARNNSPQYKTSLLHSALSYSNAFILLKKATLKELIRYGLTWLKSPFVCYKTIKAPRVLHEHFNFLINSLNKPIAKEI